MDLASTNNMTQWNIPAMEDDVFDQGIEKVLEGGMVDSGMLSSGSLGLEAISAMHDSLLLLDEPSLLEDMPLLQKQQRQNTPPLLSRPGVIAIDVDDEAPVSNTEVVVQTQPTCDVVQPQDEESQEEVRVQEEKVTSSNISVESHKPKEVVSQQQPKNDFVLLVPQKPKRSLNAYNLFFQHERQRLLKILPVKNGVKPRRSHGKMGFAEMARTISAAWKQITVHDKMEYEYQAELDRERYEREFAAWKQWHKDSGNPLPPTTTRKSKAKTSPAAKKRKPASKKTAKPSAVTSSRQQSTAASVVSDSLDYSNHSTWLE